MTNVNEILEQADEQVGKWRDHIRDAANVFHDNEDELFTRVEAIELVQEELGIEQSVAKDVVSNLVSDTIDPVIQVPANGEKYVGVVEYEEFDGAYGYLDFNDVYGKRKRVVCAQCVHDAEHEHEVTHATAGDPDGSFAAEPDASYDDLLEAVHGHYESAHDEIPEDVKTGASLASPTTIGGNTSFHAGNDGSGSGLDADLLDGSEASSIRTWTEIDRRTGLSSVGSVTFSSLSTYDVYRVDVNITSNTSDIYLQANGNTGSYTNMVVENSDNVDRTDASGFYIRKNTNGLSNTTWGYGDIGIADDSLRFSGNFAAEDSFSPSGWHDSTTWTSVDSISVNAGGNYNGRVILRGRDY